MKKNFRTVVIMLAVLSMALGLTACGSSAASEETKAPAAETADEYVYAAEFKTLSEKNEMYFRPSIYTDDGFYATCSEKVGENIPEGAVLEYEGQYDVYQSRLYFIGYDGSMQKLTNYESLPAPENTEGKRDYSSGANLSGIALAPDGGFIAIETTYENWFDGPEDMKRDNADYYNHTKYQNRFYIRKLDPDGREISSAEIEMEPDSYLHAYSMAADKDGNAIVTGDMEVRVIAPDGSTVARIALDSYADTIFIMKDGTPAYTAWGGERRTTARAGY